MKYLVQWKGSTIEHNMWEKKADLENEKEAVVEFEGRMSAEIRKQKGIYLKTEKLWRVKSI